MDDLVIKNARVILEDGMYYGGVAVNKGKISMLSDDAGLPDAKETIDAQGRWLIPGCIDAHIHIRYPGIPHRENYLSASRAAASSGTTTIIEMPLSSPPTYTVEELNKRVEAAASQSIVDFGFHGAAGEFLENIKPLADAGVLSFKTFIQSPPKGREKEFVGVVMQNDYSLSKGMEEVAKTGLPLGVHTEELSLIAGIVNEYRTAGLTDRQYHAKSRPVLAELQMVEKLIRYARQFNVPLYLTHLTNAQSLRLATDAKRCGQRIITESCPHYFYMTENDIIKYGTYAVCNPPLRTKKDNDDLWECLRRGEIDIISSDHAPYTLEEKAPGERNIFDSSPGMPGLEMRVPLMLRGVSEGQVELGQAVNALSTNVAKAFGLYPRKGIIRVGSDADMVIIDLDTVYEADHSKMYTKCRESAALFDGVKLCGKPWKTFVRGTLVFNGTTTVAEPGFGIWQKPVKM